MPRNPEPLRPIRRATLAATIYQERGYVTYALSTSLIKPGRPPRGEVLVNSSMRFDPAEVADWTPAQTIFVISNALVLPGDEVWYTPEL